MIRFAFYGKLADVMGRSREFQCARAELSVGEAIEELSAQDPVFKDALSKTKAKYAVSDAIVGTEFVVAAGDEIAVLPPFSGG